MIILDYLQNLQSEGSHKRSQYLKIMGFKLPDENIVSLEEKMGLVRKYNKNSFNFSADTTKIAFAVGNGNDENICTQKVVLTSNTAIGYTNAVLNIPEDNELPEYGNDHLSKILPFVDFASKVSPTPDYRMYCPVESKNSWYRRMYLKECMWTTQVTNTQTNQRTSLQVVCKIDKSDLKMISDSEFISEICLYSGTLTRIFDTGSNYPSTYCRDTTPDQDLVEVYPFLKIQFEPIPVAKIHATGLMFVFDLQKDNISVTIENDEENVPENSEQNNPNFGVNDKDDELEEIPTLEEENGENQEEIPQDNIIPESPESEGESDSNHISNNL